MVEASNRGNSQHSQDTNPSEKASETSDASVSDVFLEGLSSVKRRALILLALALVLLLFLPVPTQKLVVFYRDHMAPLGEHSPSDISLMTTRTDLIPGQAVIAIRYGATHSGNALAVFSDETRRSKDEPAVVFPLPPTTDGAESSTVVPVKISDALATGAGLSAVHGGAGEFFPVRIALLNTKASSNSDGIWSVAIALLLLGALALALRAPPTVEPSRTCSVGSFVESMPFWLASAVLVAAHASTFAHFDLPVALASNIALHVGLLGLSCALASWLFGVGFAGSVRAMALALVFALPFVVTGFVSALREQISLDVGTATRLGLWIALLFIVLEGMLPRVIRGRERRVALALSALEALALACPLVATVYRLIFGQIFDTPAIEAIWQTNPHEALRFASAFIPHICALVAVIALCGLGLFKANTARVRRLTGMHPIDGHSHVVCAVILIASTLGIVSEARRTPVIESFRQTWIYFREVAQRTPPENFTAHRQPLENSGSVTKNRAPQTHLVAIGESASRNHHSLYGYERQTTPWLDRMAESGNLLAFRNAYAGNKYTYHALEMALTEADQYDRRKFSESVTLVEALKAAGYTVTWLSNQERDFNRGMPFGVIAESCDVKVWTNHPGESFDEDLVGLLEKYVDPSRENVVFIHMNGSHLIYGDRTPQDQKVFSTPESDFSSAEAYDDSIRYTDLVLEKLFSTASARLNLATFTYFSDHGEVPGVPRDTFLWPMAQIPFVVWLSDEYRSAHPSRTRALMARRGEWWTNDLFFDLALGLYDVDCDRRERSKDLSSDGWAMERHRLTTENGRHYLATDVTGR